MNKYAYKQSSFSACEEIWASAAGRSADSRETVVCPKPRRVGLGHAAAESPHARPPLRRHISLHQEDCDSKAGNELLDIILSKGGCGPDRSSSFPHVDSSPPFFSGSPPSRVSNPLIQDVRFGDENFSPKPTGCIRANFGNNPTVRVEGFDCLDRDRRNCNIPTFA